MVIWRCLEDDRKAESDRTLQLILYEKEKKWKIYDLLFNNDFSNFYITYVFEIVH